MKYFNLNTVIKRLISSEAQHKAEKIWKESSHNINIENKSHEDIFMDILALLNKEDFIIDYECLSKKCSINHVLYLLENGYIDNEYLAYIYIEKSKYIKTNNLESKNFLSQFQYFQNHDYYKKVVPSKNNFVFQYAVKKRHVCFLLEELNYEDPEKLLQYLNKIEKSLKNETEMYKYLSIFSSFRLMSNHDLGENVLERLYKKNKTKYLGKDSMKILIDDCFFPFREEFDIQFLKKLKAAQRKYLARADNPYLEEINLYIEMETNAKKEKKKLERLIDNNKIKVFKRI